MKLSNLFRRTEVKSLSEFVNFLKSLKMPHVRISLSGNITAGQQWPYVMRLEARLNSGETIFFEEKGMIYVADIPPDRQMIFANKRIIVVPVEETVRAILMFVPNSRISVWDLYGNPQELEKFMMYMRA